MIKIYKVFGDSMGPKLSKGNYVISEKFSYLFRNPSVGDIVVFVKNSLKLIKRVKEVRGENYFLEGDNREFSTDSRHFGLINKKDILSKVII